MNYLGTIKIEFKEQDDVEARKAMVELEILLERFVFSELNKSKVIMTTTYKLQELIPGKEPRGIKLK